MSQKSDNNDLKNILADQGFILTMMVMVRLLKI